VESGWRLGAVKEHKQDLESRIRELSLLMKGDYIRGDQNHGKMISAARKKDVNGT